MQVGYVWGDQVDFVRVSEAVSLCQGGIFFYPIFEIEGTGGNKYSHEAMTFNISSVSS